MTDDFLVDHSTSFEYGPDPASYTKRQDTYISYTADSVMRYRVDDIEQVLNDTNLLVMMTRHHLQYQVPRLNILEEYYLGNNTMIIQGQRRKETDKSDHRVRHAFAGIISDFINSYVLGNPVKVTDLFPGEEPSPFIEVVNNFNQANDINAHNLEIGKDQNNMGRAFELLQRTEADLDRIYRLDPREVFMIYDRTARTRVIGACRYYVINEFDSSNAKYVVELYTPNAIYYYQPAEIMDVKTLTLDREEGHAFNGVPIIEYRSDRFRMSVYEKQLSQIDAYDAAQSDTANYMTDFNDAILVLEGRIKNADDAEYMKKMKDANIIILLPEDDYDGRSGAVKASYLTKSYDVAGVEAYKTRLRQDIFHFSLVPDLSDSAFSGQQSGEALKYKMFGLQQKRNDKELFLSKGFRIRYKLLENLKREVREFTGEQSQLDFQFTPNLPKAYLEELQIFVGAGGQVSQQTKLSLLSFINDVEQEIQNIDAERQASAVEYLDDWGLATAHEAVTDAG